MNIYASLETGQKNWRPQFYHNSWKLKDGSRVWYVDFQWGYFGLSANNER